VKGREIFIHVHGWKSPTIVSSGSTRWNLLLLLAAAAADDDGRTSKIVCEVRIMGDEALERNNEMENSIPFLCFRFLYYFSVECSLERK